MDDTDRNDLALRHFGARCRCTQYYRKPFAQMQPSTSSEQVYGRVDVDATKWIHVGTSPVVTKNNASKVRATTQQNMKEGFCAGFYS